MGTRISFDAAKELGQRVNVLRSTCKHLVGRSVEGAAYREVEF